MGVKPDDDTEALNGRDLVKNNYKKPDIDGQEYELILTAIDESYSQESRINIERFNPYGPEHIEGVVRKINQHRKEISVDTEDGEYWIKIDNIIKIL